ncbi:hypothetical protein [Candidatus Mycobacterium methanotrophicum]|uniref:HTH arsR-type domain-containing protein n=1 Tax=Candidatus Mycobacterium methanotrophicum TaxID=2943498 RepID=A0ABY4QJB6_9MYCO|nr:hypothetical protein [Candidatus Mycobacterium methanotrophicum]UQX09909.1 hypothetical protein M5I08_16840 [Candidatus Mycobacterium methanotrophicum]
MIGAAGRLLDIVVATNVQRSALAILRATTLQPLDEDAALAAVEAIDDKEAAKDALRHLRNIHLVKRVPSDDGRVVYFNPNVWTGHDQQFVEAALRAEDAKAQQHVGALNIGDHSALVQFFLEDVVDGFGVLAPAVAAVADALGFVVWSTPTFVDLGFSTNSALMCVAHTKDALPQG